MSASKQADMARDLSEGIQQGRYAVGSLLPTEFELCEQYGVSRYAVRQTLKVLQDLGLISRRKNVGSRVEAVQPPARFTQAIATMDELAQFGAAHVRVMQSAESVVVDLELAKALNCQGGSRWTRISSLRMVGGEEDRPIGWTDVYVDGRHADIADLARQSPQALISTLIERHYGRHITRVKQKIEATTIPEPLAAVLETAGGSPGLRIARHYYDALGDMVEISITLHPADRFQLEMEMDRSIVGSG